MNIKIRQRTDILDTNTRLQTAVRRSHFVAKLTSGFRSGGRVRQTDLAGRRCRWTRPAGDGASGAALDRPRAGAGDGYADVPHESSVSTLTLQRTRSVESLTYKFIA
ncbi:hypothetical protein EVAR_20161_1 [Eumeta japonica]|uniref:Uncharacterized protein n=1 Tax=Eumeta variegata TaxID=151549 RepID=A0A4C1UV16_EUMVA|nr:hypothetical protein EVAR_20161_1 [Eumeta japonica]